jgi:HK97 family phage portal protein
MAWNSQQNKGLGKQLTKAAPLGPGAPVSIHPGTAGKAYRDSWDIERAYRDGMQKVTWVSRCIDAIAGNQARLPVILRKNNNPNGEILDRRHVLSDLLNIKSNEGENSFIFRYRLSSQLMLSTRGVFIEKVRGRNGGLIGLNLLPPQFTSPIPDPKKFVSGYQVDLPNGMRHIIPPDQVVWIRRPHPLDPYLSLTPMESAGVAIEIENLARLYNRNYLLNDGRPGGLLVVRGEIDDDDKDELRSRFRGNLGTTGQTTVISSDDGVDFVDTSANPRDAAYVEMRRITKEEILAAFGVPESVIGNASGRTFANAAEEHRVFWNETMLPHLEPLARALDELDDTYYVDFDTSDVPILVLYKQERERYLMQEFQSGLISANEYRKGTGRKSLDSEVADQLLANPNLVPIANTEKPFSMEDQAPVAEAGAVPGQPEGPGVPSESPEGAPAPGQEMSPDEAAQLMGQTSPGAAVSAPDGGAPQAAVVPIPEGQLSEGLSGIQTKMLNRALADWETKADQSTDRWTEIVESTLDRFFERQRRVVLEKALGAKARKSVREQTFDIDQVFDQANWNRQLIEDMRPLFKGILLDAATGIDPSYGQKFDSDELEAYLSTQVERAQKVNSATKDEIAAAILTSLAFSGDEEEKFSLLKTALEATFSEIALKRKRLIAEHESQTAFNAGVFFGSVSAGVVKKKWVSRNDDKVCSEHRLLDGKVVDVDAGFDVGGVTIRFPGDPLAPASSTMNCRCKLRYNL